MYFILFESATHLKLVVKFDDFDIYLSFMEVHVHCITKQDPALLRVFTNQSSKTSGHMV